MRSQVQQLLAVAVLVAILAATGLAQELKHTTDTPAVVKKAVTDGKAVLVDVRSKEEWDKGHLTEAILLPVIDLQKGISKDALARQLPQNKIVYCHCAVGVRALTAAKILKEQGYEVRALKPGYAQLLEQGFTKAPAQPVAPPAGPPPASPK